MWIDHEEALEYRVRTWGKKVYLQGLAGLGEGLEGLGQEAILEVPLGRGHETENHCWFQADVHLEHEVNDAGDLPAALEEQFEIAAGIGSTDDAQDAPARVRF